MAQKKQRQRELQVVRKIESQASVPKNLKDGLPSKVSIVFQNSTASWRPLLEYESVGVMYTEHSIASLPSKGLMLFHNVKGIQPICKNPYNWQFCLVETFKF